MYNTPQIYRRRPTLKMDKSRKSMDNITICDNIIPSIFFRHKKTLTKFPINLIKIRTHAQILLKKFANRLKIYYIWE